LCGSGTEEEVSEKAIRKRGKSLGEMMKDKQKTYRHARMGRGTY
jgi:hypothetical protein